MSLTSEHPKPWAASSEEKSKSDMDGSLIVSMDMVGSFEVIPMDVED